MVINDKTFIKLFYTLYETCLNFTLTNRSTHPCILTRASTAFITTRHFTTFAMIFCNSIFFNALTSITIAYIVIITRYTTSLQMADCAVMSFETFASWCWNIVNKIDNTSPSILTFIKITSIGITSFTIISWSTSAIENAGFIIVRAYSFIL